MASLQCFFGRVAADQPGGTGDEDRFPDFVSMSLHTLANDGVSV